MALKPASFKLDEEVLLSGKRLRVAGYVQYEDPQAQIATRYLLAAQAGPAQILEERGGKFALLRPFPATANPVAAGNSLTVMGQKYDLAGVQKFMVLGVAGEPPGGIPRAPFLVSGSFDGSMGTLLREIAPGPSAAQTYYTLKPVTAGELMSGAQLAALEQAQQKADEQKAAAAEDEEESKPASWLKGAVGTVVSLLIIAGLAHSCTGSDSSVSISVRRR